MEIKVRKIVALILCVCLCVTAISAEAKTKKTTGKDGKYITWNYDKDTKTLTFSGKGPISEYSCAVKPHVRSDGNRQSGTRKPLGASLLA